MAKNSIPFPQSFRQANRLMEHWIIIYFRLLGFFFFTLLYLDYLIIFSYCYKYSWLKLYIKVKRCHGRESVIIFQKYNIKELHIKIYIFDLFWKCQNILTFSNFFLFLSSFLPYLPLLLQSPSPVSLSLSFY